MSHQTSSPGQRLLALHRRLHGRFGGEWLFGRMIGRMVPYTGTVRPRVEVLEPGYARVSMADRRSVRNHLGSIHAIALANLGEFASGLASLVGLPEDIRGIVVGLEVEYLKKARGTITAESRVEAPDAVTEAVEHPVTAEMRDQEGDIVARVTARWRLAPR